MVRNKTHVQGESKMGSLTLNCAAKGEWCRQHHAVGPPCAWFDKAFNPPEMSSKLPRHLVKTNLSYPHLVIFFHFHWEMTNEYKPSIVTLCRFSSSSQKPWKVITYFYFSLPWHDYICCYLAWEKWGHNMSITHGCSRRDHFHKQQIPDMVKLQWKLGSKAFCLFSQTALGKWVHSLWTLYLPGPGHRNKGHSMGKDSQSAWRASYSYLFPHS